MTANIGYLNIHWTHMIANIESLNIHQTHMTANIGCLNVHQTHMTAINSTTNNVEFFVVSDLKIVFYYNNY